MKASFSRIPLLFRLPARSVRKSKLARRIHLRRRKNPYLAEKQLDKATRRRGEKIENAHTCQPIDRIFSRVSRYSLRIEMREASRNDKMRGRKKKKSNGQVNVDDDRVPDMSKTLVGL